jgi:hypothetical protein
MQAAVCGPSPRQPHNRYRRHRPEKSVLYRLVAGHINTLFAQAEAESEFGSGYPSWVRQEFERYLGCAQLPCGFARLKCKSCGHERLCAFSCKGRAICPSCVARRMADKAAFLVDHLLPLAPYRQWTLSLPRHIRFKLARDGELLSRVLKAFVRAVFSWQRRRARALGLQNLLCGSVSFIQRFSSLLRLNIHFHSWLPDGVFTVSESGKLAFHHLPPPQQSELDPLTRTIRRRVLKLL